MTKKASSPKQDGRLACVGSQFTGCDSRPGYISTPDYGWKARNSEKSSAPWNHLMVDNSAKPKHQAYCKPASDKNQKNPKKR